MTQAYAAHQPKGRLKPFTYDPGKLGTAEVEIEVEYCGLCHSDLSMLDNEWGITQYPFIPGHEVIGKIVAKGNLVTELEIGQRVGLGWFANSCMHCHCCISGNQNLCLSPEETIVGRHGGFADKVRANYNWVVPLPDNLSPASAGPLFCGGITVFNPLVQLDIKPTDRVGVIGIGGLGHLALRFLHAWGCEITAFSSSPEKKDEILNMGASQVIDSREPKAIAEIANSLDFIISTVNINLAWNSYIAALRPQGKLHLVGMIVNPLEIDPLPLIIGQKSIVGSSLGSPVTVKEMLDFAARHHIEPITEMYAFEQINEAINKLRKGKPRYRLVLKR